MIIKKFTAKTEEEAVALAKKELGNGIVIMNVKQVKPGGLLGFLRAKQTEVTVALEEETESLRRTVKENVEQEKASSILQKICKDRNISYNDLKCEEVLSLNNDFIEDEYLESLFSYVELLKELIGSYFYAKESVDRE